MPKTKTLEHGVTVATAKPARPRTLSREDILDAADKLLRSRGLRGLTMRALGEALNVSPMAVYNHVANRDEIVAFLFERTDSLTGPLELDDNEPWFQTLLSYLTTRWINIERYTDWASELQHHSNLALGRRRHEEQMRFFEQVGFSRNDANLASSFISTYLLGRLCLTDRVHGMTLDDQREDLTAEDYATFGFASVVAGLRAKHEQTLAAG